MVSPINPAPSTTILPLEAYNVIATLPKEIWQLIFSLIGMPRTPATKALPLVSKSFYCLQKSKATYLYWLSQETTICYYKVMYFKKRFNNDMNQSTNLAELFELTKQPKQLELDYALKNKSIKSMIEDLAIMSARTNLKSLIIEKNNFIELPDLSKFSNLQSLRIQDCADFSVIDNVSCLSSLRTLEINDCDSFNSFMDLRALNLDTLIISECEEYNEKLLVPTTLTLLDISGCYNYDQELDLTHVKHALKTLDISAIGYTNRPLTFVGFSNLTKLTLGATLDFQPSITFQDLPLLEEINLKSSGNLNAPLNFIRLPALRKINMKYCRSFKAAITICDTPCLQTFILKGCTAFNKYLVLDQLSHLKDLDLQF